MARTPSKRWETLVVEAGCYNDVTGPYTVKLLSLQHKEFTELVRKLRATTGGITFVDGYHQACDDILAALQQGGKK